MKILAIESSGLAASAAVLSDGILAGEYTINHKKTHSQTLLPMIDEVIRMLEIDLSELDGIAVSGGPGSFTGLRIGSATAKGLGLALDIPLMEVPTTEVLAYNLYDAAGLVCPVMDARRDQVYTGIFRYNDHELATVMEQKPMAFKKLADMLNRMGESVIFTGDGTGVHRQHMEELLTCPWSIAPPHLNLQKAGALAVLGEKYLRSGKTVSAAAHRPDYLRLSQAERERLEREAKAGKEDMK